jgi:hypothetical protein
MTEKLPPLVWLWIPLLGFAGQILIEIFARLNFRLWWVSEDGPLELLQFAILMIALIFALLTLRQPAARRFPWLVAWLGLAILCCIFVGGEEISWGQWFFHWQTPDVWARINDQDETNLHNTSSWLDQKPRLMLELGTAVGGLLIPLLRKTRPQWLPTKFTIIYPNNHVIVDAAIYAGIKLAQSFANHIFHVSLFQRSSEVEELYMYYFVLLYLIGMKARLTRPVGP